MIIASGNGWPSSALSNFAGHGFVFDGIECGSMEGFLQSLKFDKPHIQREVAKLVGKGAKFRGKARNRAWQKEQCLWFKGMRMERNSKEYKLLLWKAYCALFDQSESFRKALMHTKGMSLSHPLGSNQESVTVLTEREFVGILKRLRDTQPVDTGKSL